MQCHKIKLALTAALTTALFAGGVTSAHAQWTLGQWNLGSNGHYYSVQAITGGSFDWTISRSQAQALLGPNGESVDLATITSSTENNFIFAGIDSPIYWAIDGAGSNEGPNLGGFQMNKLAEPAGNWAWVTGEAWSFTSWSPSEPNNSVGGTEDFLTFYGQGSARSGNWNDIGNGTGNSVIRYYVAETTTIASASAPEPGTLAFLALGGTLVVVRRRRC
jgi:hypothetical protein